MWFDTYGKLVYKDNWYANIIISDSIGKYHRRLYKLFKWHTEKLLPPMNDSHVNIIRGEEPLEHYKKILEALGKPQIMASHISTGCSN